MSVDPFKQRFVLDTSAILTQDIRDEGQDVGEAADELLELIAQARLSLGISCYMPPSVYTECTRMLADREVDDAVMQRLGTWVIRKHPDRYAVTIPADVVYEFIDEMSRRVNRGLRVSEDVVRRAEQLEPEPLDDHEHKTATDELITELREKYRTSLRKGVLDSREDFDLLILARELNAGVVTEDAGIIDWTEDFGLRYLRGGEFPDLLRAYLTAAETGL